MKETKSPSRISKIDASEVTYSNGKLSARFHLLDNNNYPIAQTEHQQIWSPRTIESLRAFLDALEEDAMKIVFGEGIEFTVGGTEDEDTELYTGVGNPVERIHAEYTVEGDIGEQF